MSLAACTRLPYELILINNASDERTTRYVEDRVDHLQNVKYVKNDANLGFTVAANQGTRIASGDIVVQLNSDTVLTSGWLSALVEAFRWDERIGIVGPKILFPGTDVIHTIGGMVHTKRRCHLPPGRDLHKSDPRFARPMDCQYIEGSCMAIARKVIEKIGLFDEVYSPGFYEDVDYCFQAREAGFRTIYTPHAEIYHYGGTTFQKESTRATLPKGGDNEKIFRERWGERLPE